MSNVYAVGLFGHNKTGKTTLAEAMLVKAKAIDRMGDIAAGTTALDHDEEAVRRAMSVSMGVARFEWNKNAVCLIDTPGYMDFVGEQLSGLEAADLAVLNVAADGGVEIGTEKAWEALRRRKTPTVLFVNRLDLADGAAFAKLWSDCESFFGVKMVLVNRPEVSGGAVTGVVPVLENPDGAGEPYAAAARASLDALAELDDAVMERYLDGQKLTPDDIASLLRKGLLEGTILPVLCGSAAAQAGAAELLDFIIAFMPKTADLPPAVGKDADGNEVSRPRTAEAPLSGVIVKTISDPFIGRLSYLKVVSGRLSANSAIQNSTRNAKERTGQLLRLQGKKQDQSTEAFPGDVVAVAKLSSSGSFDTFCDPAQPIVYPAPAVPEGAVSYSIIPKVKGTEDKLGNALGRIVEEDPCVKVFRDNETGETILSGMGDVHLDVTINKFKNRFGVEVEKGIPKIAYKETVTAAAQAEGKHKKQTGGRGQFGHCYIKVEPLPRGGGFEFVDEIVGGAIPRNFIPSVEKGVREAMNRGVLAGYPVVDFRVRLYDGSYHTVDSSDIAFQLAGILALNKALQEARPILLEPIVNAEIRVPAEFVGEIIGTINAKRGRVLDMLVAGGSQVVKAQVPLAEMSSYTSEIRSITSGKGSYSVAFSHYEVVPSHIAEKVTEQRRKEKEEEKG